MRSITASVRLLLLPVLMMLAQAEPEPAAEPVKAEIRLFLWNQAGPTLLTNEEEIPPTAQEVEHAFFIPKGEEFREVKCQPQMYSAPFTYRGGRKFQLFRKGEADSKEAAFVPIAETTLPTGDGKYILFLDGDLKALRILVFPYDTSTVGKGKMLLFNTTDKELSVALDKEKVPLQPNEMSVFDVSTFTDYQMPLEILEKSENDWLPRLKTRRAIRFDDRNVAIIYQDTQARSIGFALLPPIKEGKVR